MTDPEPQLIPSTETRERNWIPLAVAAAIVLVLVGVLAIVLRKPAPTLTPVSAPLDPYATSLPITRLVMSESTNLVGGKVTYIDGHIANTGQRTVTLISVQALFRDFVNQVAQNETQPLKLIRTREPYIDVEPVSAAPLKPGDQRDFRLIFDRVSPDWNGAYPELRIVHVDCN